jgi:hypothetical protein
MYMRQTNFAVDLSTGVLPAGATKRGARTEARGIDLVCLAGSRPVEQMAHRRQALLHRGSGLSLAWSSIHAATCIGDGKGLKMR